MMNEIKYEEGPIGEVKLINDFLPSPEELVFREETVKICNCLEPVERRFFLKKKRISITFPIKD